MYPSFLKNILVICFLALTPGLYPETAQAKKNNSFNVSVEYYKTGADLFKDGRYLKMVFTISEIKKGQSFEAILDKGIFSGNRNFFKSTYFETGVPFSGRQPFTGFAFQFYRNHPIHFHLENGKVIIDNAEFLTSTFSEKKKNMRKRLSITANEESTNGCFSMSKLSSMFQQMFIKIPEDLLAPEDLSLSGGDVYNYLGDFAQFRHIEITRIKQHEKVNLFVDKNSSVVRYSLINGLENRMVIRVYPQGEGENFSMSGQFQKTKNSAVHYTLEPLSPFSQTKDSVFQTDAEGKFNLKLKIVSPVTLSTGNGFLFYAEPGDKFSFYSNQTQDSLFFSGIGAANNTFLQEESRLKKLPAENPFKNKNDNKTHFRFIDRIMNPYFELIDSYQNELTPVFFENRYLDYYFGTINRKLRYLFRQIEVSPGNGIIPRKYTGLDTIPIGYQSFVFNPEYYKYLENNLIINFEKLRNFRFVNGYTDYGAPSEKELVMLASLAYSGKALQDYLSQIAVRIAGNNDQEGLDELKKVVDEKFNNSPLQSAISRLLNKSKRIETGEQFPPVRFLDLNEKPLEISAFKGKVVYLMFWRNDAMVFDKQWEEYQNLIRSTKTDQVVFVNAGLEKEFRKWKSYVEGMNFPGTNLFVSRKSSDFLKYLQNLKSRHYFLIDQNGKVINNNGPDPSVANLLIVSDPGQSNREKTLLGGLIFFVALLLITGLIWLISRQQQKRKTKITTLVNRLRETELKAIKAQMNPHFLFNSLNSIQSLINRQNIEDANVYLSKFAKLLRSVLQHSEKEFIPLSDELKTIKLYVQLEKLRFSFNFILDVSPELDIYNTFIPPLLVQPFLENAILHGLQPKEGDKLLEVKFFEKDKDFFCQITDNGVGQNASTKSSDHPGIGNKLSLERINLLNQKNNSNFKLQIEDLNPEPGGTRVTISYINNLI